MDDDTLANGDPITSIADLVRNDYDGGEIMNAEIAHRILSDWRRASERAKEMIDARGMDRAAAEYVEAWDAAHRAEYGLEDA